MIPDYVSLALFAKLYIECIVTEFGTLQIRRNIRSVEITDVKITSVNCNMMFDVHDLGPYL